MTRSVKCPANITGVCHLWSVSCGLTRTMTMCLLVESLTYFHQKILWMQQGICYLFSESKGIAGKLYQEGTLNAQQGLNVNVPECHFPWEQADADTDTIPLFVMGSLLCLYRSVRIPDGVSRPVSLGGLFVIGHPQRFVPVSMPMVVLGPIYKACTPKPILQSCFSSCTSEDKSSTWVCNSSLRLFAEAHEGVKESRRGEEFSALCIHAQSRWQL